MKLKLLIGALLCGAAWAQLPQGVVQGQRTTFSPTADSTTAIQFNKADGTTNVLTVDTTNSRLGIGTASPGALLDVNGVSYFRSTISLNNIASFSGNDIAFLNGGKVTMAASSVGIGPSNTSPTGTLHVYDATASTGVTKVTVRAGAGQSTTNLQEWQNNAGTVQASISAGGSYFVNGGALYNGKVAIGYNTSAELVSTSDSSIKWVSTTNLTNSYDLGLARNAAGVLRVTDGSTGTAIIVTKLPTSCSGLVTGTLYNNSGTAAFCP